MAGRIVEAVYVANINDLKVKMAEAAALNEKAGMSIGTAFTKGTSVAGTALNTLSKQGQALGVPLAGSLAKVSSALDQAASKTAKLGVAMSALGKVGMTAGLAAFAAAAYEGVKGAAALQKQMEMIHTQAGKSQAEVQNMTKAVLGMASSVGTNPQTLADGMYHIESAGYSGAQALKMLTVAAKGAKIGNADLTDTAQALAAVMYSNIPGAKDMASAMGMLNATVGAGDMTMQQLNEAFQGPMLATVKGYGLSIKDVGASLADFGDLNIRGADAATQLRMAVQYMAKPAASAAPMLKALGLNTQSFADALRNGGLLPAIDLLQQKLSAAKVPASQYAQVVSDLFSKKGSSGVEILLNSLDRLHGKYTDIDKGSSSFNADWTATTHNLSFQWSQLEAGAAAFADKLGGALIPKLQALGSFVAKHQGQFEALAKIFGVVLVAAMTKFAAESALKFGSWLTSFTTMAKGATEQAAIITGSEGLAGVANEAEAATTKIDNLKAGLAGIAGKVFTAALVIEITEQITSQLPGAKNGAIGNDKVSKGVENIPVIGTAYKAAMNVDNFYDWVGSKIFGKNPPTPSNPTGATLPSASGIGVYSSVGAAGQYGLGRFRVPGRSATGSTSNDGSPNQDVENALNGSGSSAATAAANALAALQSAAQTLLASLKGEANPVSGSSVKSLQTALHTDTNPSHQLAAKTLEDKLIKAGQTGLADQIAAAFKNVGTALNKRITEAAIAAANLKLQKSGNKTLAGLQADSNSGNISSLQSDLSPTNKAALDKLADKLNATHKKSLENMASNLESQWKSASTNLATLVAAAQATADNDALALQTDKLNAQTTAISNAAANQTQIVSETSQQEADAMTAAANLISAQSKLQTDQMAAATQAITDSSKLLSDAAAIQVNAINAQTTAITAAANAQATQISDQATTKSDKIGEGGLFGLALVAQQAKVAVDVQKQADDAAIAAAQAHVDQVTAQSNQAVAVAQQQADAVTAQGNANVAIAQQSADTSAINSVQTQAIAQAQADATQIAGTVAAGIAQAAADAAALTAAIKLDTAQGAVDAAEYGGAIQQAQASAALRAAQAQANSANAAAASQVGATQDSINAANAASAAALQQAQSAASQADANAQAQIAQAQGLAAQQSAQVDAQLAAAQAQASLIQATAQQQLAAIQGQAQVQEAQLNATYTIDSALSSSTAGAGYTVNIYGLPANDAAAIDDASAWTARNILGLSA